MFAYKTLISDKIWRAASAAMAPSSRRLVTTMTTTATPPHRFFQAPLASSLSSQYSFVPSNRHHRDSNVLVIRQHHLHDAANLTSTLPHRRFFVTTQNDDGGDAKPLTIQLYQYAICPFCNRVKALLDYAGVDYQTVEVNPLTKAEIKPWKTEHTKVPIAIIQTDDKTVAAKPFFGSDVIVQGLLEYPFIQSCLWERWQGSTMTLEDFQHGPAVAHWTDFAANDLATLLYPNMCRTWGDSYRAFDYVHKNTSTFGPLQRVMIQSVGSLAIYLAASKIKKKRNITDERQALEDVLSSLEQELRRKPFLSGHASNQPDLGDLAVFGTLRAIEGLPVYDKFVRERGGLIVDWYDRIKAGLLS